MGRFLDRAKARASAYIEQKRADAAASSARAKSLKERAKTARQEGYDAGYLKQMRKEGGAAGRKAAQGGGGLMGTLGTFGSGFGTGVLGTGSAPSGRRGASGPATYVKVGKRYVKVHSERTAPPTPKGDGGFALSVPDFGSLSGLGPSKGRKRSINDLLL